MSDYEDKYTRKRELAITTQKLETEKARARLLTLEYERRSGSLAKIEDMEKLFFNIFRAVRDIYMSAPNRFSSLGASRLKCDELELYNFLDEMMRECSQQAAHLEALKIPDASPGSPKPGLFGDISGTGAGVAAERIRMGGS